MQPRTVRSTLAAALAISAGGVLAVAQPSFPAMGDSSPVGSCSPVGDLSPPVGDFSRPGNGFGDKNHCHTGAPGR